MKRKLTINLSFPASDMPGVGVVILTNFIHAMHGLAGIHEVEVLDHEGRLVMAGGEIKDVVKKAEGMGTPAFFDDNMRPVKPKPPETLN